MIEENQTIKINKTIRTRKISDEDRHLDPDDYIMITLPMAGDEFKPKWQKLTRWLNGNDHIELATGSIVDKAEIYFFNRTMIERRRRKGD